MESHSASSGRAALDLSSRNRQRLPAMGGRAKSCTSCRQVKTKCNVKMVYPETCTRCKDRNIECKLDPGFKRIAKRGRLEEVTEKLTHLQHVLGVGDADSLDSLAPETLNLPQRSGSRSSAPPVAPPCPAIGQLPVDEQNSGLLSCFCLDFSGSNPREPLPRTLGNVAIPGGAIANLFTRFYFQYSRYMPIVNTSISIEDIFESSPILFWTIIVVSSQHNPHHPDIYTELAEPYKALLSTVILGHISSLQTIQAILLLCLWPFPVKQQHNEPSLNYCSLAISAALQMGLHRPNHSMEYKVSDKVESSFDSMMTWMACFQISTLLSSHIGVPLILDSDVHLEIIRSMCRNMSVPREFAAQTEVQRYVAKYISALNPHSDPQTRYSIVQLYDHEIEAIRSYFQDSWSPLAEFNVLGAKLYLYAIYFTPQTASIEECAEDDRSSDTRIYIRTILYQGLRTVVRLVNIFSQLCRRSTPESHTDTSCADPDDFDHPIHCPKIYLRVLFFAVCFLLFFISENLDATEIDKRTVQVQVEVIYQIFSNCRSSNEHRHAAKNIIALKNAIELEIKSSSDTVKSRLGANIFFNALRAAKVLKHRNRGHKQVEVSNSEYSEPGLQNTMEYRSFSHLGSDFFSWDFPWNLQDTSLGMGTDLHVGNSSLP